MKYAIFRVNHETKYGKNDPLSWQSLGAEYEVIETFHNIRAASASLKMRNDAVKTMTADIKRARRSGLFEPVFLDALEALRDADSVPYGPSAVERMTDARKLLAERSKTVLLDGFNKIANDRKHASNVAKYAKATQPRPGSIDALSDAERDALRESTIAAGWKPLF